MARSETSTPPPPPSTRHLAGVHVPTAHLAPMALAADSKVTASTGSHGGIPRSAARRAEVTDASLTDATCVEFLHIMREFSESSCNLNEMVERVDSLVHQDEQLQRLLPLNKCGGHSPAQDDEDNDIDEDARSHTAASIDGSTDDEGSRADGEMDANADAKSDRSDGESTCASKGDLDLDTDMDLELDLDEEQERQAQEDLQRWMELELDMVGAVDPYDDVLRLPITTSAACADRADQAANSKTMLRGKKRAIAELSEDTRREVDAIEDARITAIALARKTRTSSEDTEMSCDLDDVLDHEEDVNAGMWGMEVDPFERDMLTSLDHSVLCDRDNRFLQWDLEIEAVKAAVTQSKTELRTPPPASSSQRLGSYASCVDSARQKLLMEASPRDHKMTLPARQLPHADSLDLTEDWNALDFGSFQNRTVSHILSSCLHKRKLQHPYKDRVTLISFNVPGGEAIGAVPSGSMPGSILFGSDDMDATSGGPRTTGKETPKSAKSGERKAKKPRNEERKRQNAQKLRETLAELEGTFTEHDLDTRGAPKIKLENLPLPDLANLPQDLKELKRKIEATEHKVEGTKHRHRKGGPCPRCQVQNQLRAAKRAYHKRAVAHKKLPQLASPTMSITTPVPSPTSVASVLSTPSLAVAIPDPAVASNVSASFAAKLPTETQPSAVAPTKLATSPVVAVPQTAGADTTASLAATAKAVMAVPAIQRALLSTTSAATPAVSTVGLPIVNYPARRLCGESAVSAAAFATATTTTSNPNNTPSSVPAAVSAASTASSSPQLQQVTVTSA